MLSWGILVCMIILTKYFLFFLICYGVHHQYRHPDVDDSWTARVSAISLIDWDRITWSSSSIQSGHQVEISWVHELSSDKLLSFEKSKVELCWFSTGKKPDGWCEAMRFASFCGLVTSVTIQFNFISFIVSNPDRSYLKTRRVE